MLKTLDLERPPWELEAPADSLNAADRALLDSLRAAGLDLVRTFLVNRDGYRWEHQRVIVRRNCDSIPF